ncbi:MAG TPA: hypothetical protein VK970_00045, partial [Candidatus Methylacidiphilales bacterium]|nr:hypothetical protein [Candidatus Methylacidiphilales bacterium]
KLFGPQGRDHVKMMESFAEFGVAQSLKESYNFAPTILLSRRCSTVYLENRVNLRFIAPNYAKIKFP